MEVASRHNLIVVDDSAETLMTRYKNGMAGTHAHIGVFSFEKSKHMTSGSEGGMIVTSDPELAVRRVFAGIGYKGLTAEAGRTSLASSVAQNQIMNVLTLLV